MRKKLFNIFLIALILGAFFGQNYNAYFNGHYHLLHSGRWIFHAHPYAKTSHESPVQPAHSHSKVQLLSYELLLTSIFLLVLFFVFYAWLQLWIRYTLHNETKLFTLHFPSCHPHRGPPCFSF